MAPAGESKYFPSLDKCLEGEYQLLSWEAALTALGSAKPERYGALEQFLADEYSLACLSRPFDPFPPPTPFSRSSFETKTAAINVTPTQKGRYSTTELKEDALWLSEKTKTEEISALRIVVLDWQLRPVTKLLRGLTEEEILSLQDAGVGTMLRRSGIFSKSTAVARPTEDATEERRNLDSSESRRKRLLRLYMSERCHILKIAETLICAGTACEHQTSPASKTKGHQAGKRKLSSSWVSELGRVILRAQAGRNSQTKDADSFVLDAISALKQCVSRLANGSGWFSLVAGNEPIEALFGTFQLLNMVYIMRLTFVHIDRSPDGPSNAEVLSWYRLMQSERFFQDIQVPSENQQSFREQVQMFTSILSLLLLSLPRTLDSIAVTMNDQSNGEVISGDEFPLIFRPEDTREIHAVLMEAAGSGSSVASVAMFAWAIILQNLRNAVTSIGEDSDSLPNAELEDGHPSPKERRPSTLSNKQLTTRSSALERTLEMVVNTTAEDEPIAFLANRAVSTCRVYAVITDLATHISLSNPTLDSKLVELRAKVTLLEVIRESLPMTKYSPEIITATLAILNISHSPSDTGDDRSTTSIDGPVDVFMRDDEVLLPGIFEEAQFRYPYELLPFLKLCRTLLAADTVDDDGTPYVGQLLGKMPKFTAVLSGNFRAYELYREDENANCVQLTEPLALFYSRKTSQPVVGDEGLFVPEGTIGFVISESRPFVTTWQYRHSALKYLGTLLSTAIPGGDLVELATLSVVDPATTPEIITLFSSILSSSVKTAKGSGRSHDKSVAALRILEEASDGLNRNQDIVTVIFNIFEAELQTQLSLQASLASTETLAAVFDFCNSLMSVLPGRVWPFLAQKELLENDGGESKVSAIIASVEMINGRYPFLIAVLNLLDAMVEDAVSHVISRKISDKAVVRFGSVNNSSAGVSERAMSRTLLAFCRLVVDVLESSQNWKFAVAQEQMEINKHILRSLDKVVYYVYGFDDSRSPDKKITGILAPSANYILDVFLSPSTDDIPLGPILNVFFMGGTSLDPLEPAIVNVCRVSQTLAALRFSRTLVSVRRTYKPKSSFFEKQLFKTLPLLARLYASQDFYHSPIILLLDALIVSANRDPEEPPSLLGHMGSDTAQCFLDLLSRLNRPLLDPQLERDAWTFFASIVSTRQQWFAVYILTGSAPRDALRESRNNPQAVGNRSILTVALEYASSLQAMDPTLASVVLRFLALAVNFWPSAIDACRKNPSSMNGLVKFLGWLESRIDNEQHAQEPVERRMAASIAEILAVYFRAGRLMGDTSTPKEVVPNLGYFRKNALVVPDYNTSLHTNLKKNLEKRFAGCTPVSFKRTNLARSEIGRDYLYSLDFASKILGFDPAWSGAKTLGFAEEFERANINLSHVDTQTELLLSWKYLVIELSHAIDQDQRIQKLIIRVVGACMKVNAASSFPVQEIRADLAFTLLQRLAAVPKPLPEAKELLPMVWEAIRSTDQDFELAFADYNAPYYRLLLKILFLALRFHITEDDPDRRFRLSLNGQGPLKPSDIATTVLEVLSEVIAKGFRSLSKQVHEDPNTSTTSDFALLTAMLQIILRIPGISSLYSHITQLFTNQNTTQYATSLFSWSDRLAIKGDPVHGELSILFLLSLSSVPLMAQHLAAEGILSNLSTANITNYYRRPAGMGPFDDPVRVHSIWTRGILPLCLNLLGAVGPPLASEVAAFLNQFPHQLSRAADALDSKRTPSAAHPTAGGITTGAASEIHSLAMITRIFDQYRSMGAAAGVPASEIPDVVWDRAGVKEDVEEWLQGRKALRERIVPCNEREVQLARAKPRSADSGAENRLEEMVVGDLVGALECLNGDNVGAA